MIEPKLPLSCLRSCLPLCLPLCRDTHKQTSLWAVLLLVTAATLSLPSFAQKAPSSNQDSSPTDHRTTVTTLFTNPVISSSTNPVTTPITPLAVSSTLSSATRQNFISEAKDSKIPDVLSEATTSASNNAVIAIIIDDLGNLKQRDLRALHLPGDVTLSFLPQTPYARSLAQRAHQLNKEVMLHLPMQAIQNKLLGPGGLTLDMTATELAQQLERNLASVPHVAGVNNHMGSLLTQQPSHMQWLMQALKTRSDLYFVDSYTTKTSIAQKVATEHWVPNVRRDVFLDHVRDPDTIRFHLRRLIKKAKKNGSALAIGHPFPETMAILEQAIPELHKQGITLVPVSQLLQYQIPQILRQAATQTPDKTFKNESVKTPQKVSHSTTRRSDNNHSINSNHNENSNNTTQSTQTLILKERPTWQASLSH